MVTVITLDVVVAVPLVGETDSHEALVDSEYATLPPVLWIEKVLVAEAWPCTPEAVRLVAECVIAGATIW